VNSKNDFDAFGDIINTQTGIFSGESAGIEPGLQNFDRAQTVAKPDGVKIVMHCRAVAGSGQGCGRAVEIDIEYPELVALKYGISPHAAFQGQPNVSAQPGEWRYNEREQAWFPLLACPNCRTLTLVFVTPEEAEKHLATARRQGWINPKGEQFASQVAAARAQQLAAQLSR
jgi:hypothetical protein